MSYPDEIERSALPIRDQPYPGTIVYDAEAYTAIPPIHPVRPPQGAPNVVTALVEDVGLQASNAFGGPVHTPNAEWIAAGDLKYTPFHTKALCTPARAALITGRVRRDDTFPRTYDYPAATTPSPAPSKWIEMKAGTDSHDHLIDIVSVIGHAIAKQWKGLYPHRPR
jgi:hypothetical protein